MLALENAVGHLKYLIETEMKRWRTSNGFLDEDRVKKDNLSAKVARN